MNGDIVALAVCPDAAARAGRHSHGAGRCRRLRLPQRQRTGPQDRRSHLHAHGDGLEFRRGAAVPADGLIRHHIGHEPRAVSGRQRLSLGHLRGGLGIATIAACGGFAAICGSSVATAATFSRVAFPEMRRFGYPQSFATGVIAAGGTLGIMIPPSTVLAVYGLITEQDIGKLFVAGIVPGLLAVLMYMATITIIGRVRPEFLPAGKRAPWRERWRAMREVWATLGLFLFVIGGIYGGLFTATEAAGWVQVAPF
jgi:hypothetical protein